MTTVVFFALVFFLLPLAGPLRAARESAARLVSGSVRMASRPLPEKEKTRNVVGEVCVPMLRGGVRLCWVFFNVPWVVY